MRADRLISLVLLLRHRGRMSAAQLADELEVSERTVLRDIDALSTSGFPVYAERGRNGGFRLLPGFTTDLTGLSIEEATALLSGEASMSLGMSSAFASAMRKLSASLPEDRRESASRVADRVLVRPDGWFRNPGQDRFLDVVQEAVFVGRRLEIDYEGPQAPARSRTVDPLGLVYAGGRWYLMALDRGKERTYRVSRIRRAVALEEPARRSATIDLASMWDARRSQFRSTVRLIEARLRVRAECLAQVEASAVRVGATHEGADGWTTLDVTFGGEAHAGSLVWTLGNACELLGPDELRTALCRRAREMAEMHSSDAS